MLVNIPDYRRQLLACQQSASLNPYAAVTCPSALDAEVRTDLDCQYFIYVRIDALVIQCAAFASVFNRISTFVI